MASCWSKGPTNREVSNDKKIRSRSCYIQLRLRLICALHTVSSKQLGSVCGGIFPGMWCIGRNVYAVAGVEQIFFSFQGKQTAALQNIENFFFGMGVKRFLRVEGRLQFKYQSSHLGIGQREGGSVLDKLAGKLQFLPLPGADEQFVIFILGVVIKKGTHFQSKGR